MEAVILARSEKKAQKLKRQIKALGEFDNVSGISKLDKTLQYLETYLTDIVFFDIDDELTDWQGICSRVKYADSNIWLVLLSSDPFKAVKAFEAGASDFLYKPIDKKQLLMTLIKQKRIG